MSNDMRPLTAAQLAKAQKKELLAIEGKRAMADIDMQARAVRKNMERLKALRLAAESAKEPPDQPDGVGAAPRDAFSIRGTRHGSSKRVR